MSDSDLIIEIEGEQFDVEQKVFDLLRSTSIERDKAYSYLKYLYDIVGNKEKIPMLKDIKNFIYIREKAINSKKA